MVKKLSNEEIRQINFIRKFDNTYIDSWSLDCDYLSMSVIENGVKYRIVTFLSSFVSRWFVQVWSVKLATRCPSPSRSQYTQWPYSFYGYNFNSSPELFDNSYDLVLENSLIDEVYDTDIR